MPDSSLGVEVEGLTESIKALTKVSKEAGAEAKGLIRDGAKHIQSKAQGKMARRSGGGSYPRRKGAIRYSATQRGGAISITSGKGSRYPWIFGAEFGAKRAWVYGRVMSASRLGNRRQFPVWRGNQFVERGANGPGWLVQPAIREELPKVTRDIEAGLSDLIAREIRRARVPRSG